MPYYAAGDYYQAGDFLGIGKALKKLNPLKLIGGALRLTPVGAAVSAARSLLPGISGPMIAPPGILAPGQIKAYPEPGIGGMVHRALPGGSSGYGYYNKQGEFIEGRRPRMNVLNPRALRRAARRAKGFLRFANQLGALPLNRGKGKKLFKRKRR